MATGRTQALPRSLYSNYASEIVFWAKAKVKERCPFSHPDYPAG